MFDTYVTIVGNCITAPERRRTTTTGSLVTSFKVASTARRLNRETGEWVDGNSLRVRVTCWRRLAESVATCVKVGDPVIVAGRLYTRDWVDEHQTRRVFYELEAVAVGHDLGKGQATFARIKPAMATSMVEDDDNEGRVRDEPTERVADDDLDDDFATAMGLGGGYGPSYAVGGADGADVGYGQAGPGGSGSSAIDFEGSGANPGGPDLGADGVYGAAGDERSAARGADGEPEPGGSTDEGAGESVSGDDSGADAGRRRRGRGRVSVSA